MTLSENANLIFKNRYAIHEDETWRELSERVATGGAQIESDFKKWKDIFTSDIYNMLFLPGGRILRNVGRPRGTLFNCLSKDTDILTEDGFVRIDELKEGSKILNGNGEFSTVKKVFENGYKEKLLEFSMYGFGKHVINSTYDHKFKIFNFKNGIIWKTAKEINPDIDFMVIPKIKSNEKINSLKVNEIVNINELYPNKEYIIEDDIIKFKNLSKRKKDNEYNQRISYINNEIYITKEFCRLVGYYLSEGTSINNGNSIIFSFNENENKFIEDVITLIKDIFGLDSITRENTGKSTQICVNSQILNLFFSNLFGRKSKDKHIPWWWYSLNDKCLMETLVGCIRGDGCQSYKGKRGTTINFRVSNKLLSYQIFMIGNNLNISTGFTVSKNRKLKSFDGEYISSIWSANFGILNNNPKLLCRLNDFSFNDDYCIFPIKNKKEVYYNDYVYDISMEDNTNPHFTLIGAVAHNCYVEPLDDSMRQIGQFQMNSGILWSEGGGVGCNASFLRPEDAPIIQKGGTSSGPISFLKWANAGANCIKTGGARRAAALAMMNVSHPDIIKFINAKLVEGELNCFNISVAVTEEFLQAVEADDNWDLVWKTKVWNTVKARDIWNLILDNMVRCAEPGLINWDNLRSNNSYYFDPILSTNPCFSNDIKVLTKQGHFEIQDLVGKEVDIWDGNNWVTINNFRVTGENQKMLKITLYDGSEMRVTPYHKFYFEESLISKEARELKEGDKLSFSNAPLVHGNIEEKGAYIKGFLLGDGSIKREDEPLLRLYEPKYCCERKLIESANEVFIEEINTNAIEKLEFNYEEINDRKNLTGLTVRKKEFYKWCNEYKNKLPKDIFQWNLKSKCEFLAGFFDADGSIMDNEKAYGYQVWANSKKMLQDIQLLLKTIGVQSKLSLGKKAMKKDFNNGYGEYECNESYRLTIPQRYSIELSKLVKFIRLKDFSDRKVKRIVKEKYNMVVSVKEDGIDDKVYCCTVPNTHKVSLSLGILTGQCGEVPLGAHGVCCLGSLVLPNFITGTRNTNWQLMEKTVYNAIRFLDNIIQINRYVIEDVKRKAFDGRRIGIGVMGLAEYLFAKGVRYGSKEATRTISTLMENIRNYAYEASCKIAEEKEPFPKFDVKEYSKAHFFKTLPASLRMSIKKHGMRNVSVMAVAPTGCQDKDTMIVTNKGILSLEEIGNINGEEWQDINLKVSQEKYNEERDATRFYINGEANTKKIYLKSGNIIESTYNHQYRVLEEVIGIGTYVWKRADELKVGDDIVSVLNTYNKNTNPDLININTTHGNQNNIKQINSMNEKLAEFLGIYFGDGSNHNKGIRINCNYNNEEEYEYVAELGEEVFDIKPTFYNNKRNCMSVCFNSQLILNFLKLNGLLKQKSNKISIPKIIRMSSRSCIEAFIKGLLFADGSKSGNNIYLDTSSKKLSKELLVIMRSIGTDVRIQEHISGLGSKIFRIWFKKGVYKYRPLKEKRKKEQLEKLGLYYCITDEIVKIEDSRNYTYDIEVPSTVTYIANSVVSHNTISLIPEVTSSIEPLFCKAYLRNDEISKRAYIHPIYKKIIENNERTPDWYVDSFDLKPEDHFETQVAVQKYLDGAVSKTINCPRGFKPEQLSDLLLEYIRDLKGVTLYVDGSRTNQILNPLTKKEARKYIQENRIIRSQEERDCSTGACEI